MKNKGHLTMSQKERMLKVLLEAVKMGQLTLKEAGKRIGLSYPQMKRRKRRYLEEGDKGLIHRRRGQSGNRAFPKKFKDAVLARYQERYMDFGPTFAQEKLLEEGLKLHHDTLRRWLVAEGLWHRQRKVKPYRQRRDRREAFGELVQLDGSFHPWFSKDRASDCLMNMIDDATGIRYGLMAEEETTEAAMRVLWGWIKRYGIPKALYVDLKNVYSSPHSRLTEEEKLLGIEETLSVFGQVCAKLGIEVILAYSPQAKGRVERCHGVYQDRLVKEIKLQGMTSIEQVNHFLEQGFIDGLNRKFAADPKQFKDVHRPTTGYDLNTIFSWEFTRVLQQDWTIRVSNIWYQILQGSPLIVRPKYQIRVRRHLDGSITLWYKDQPLRYRILEESEKQALRGRNRADLKPKLTVEERRLLASKYAKHSTWRHTNHIFFGKRAINF
jgi:transposase